MHSVSECVDVYSILSLNSLCTAHNRYEPLTRWMHYYRANKYVFSGRLKQSVLLAGSRIKSGSEFQAIGPATENARRP